MATGLASLYIPIWKYRLRKLVLSIRLIPKSMEERHRIWQQWFDQFSPVGSDPFSVECRYKTWAGPDDCDLNMHLSNSSYPKNLDIARFIAGTRLSPTIFRVGGWIALGATHFKFLREIPIFSTYEMRTTIATWDHKWFYTVTRYVTHPKNKRRNARTETVTPPINVSGIPDIHTPATPSLLPPLDAISNLTSGSKDALLKALATREEPDGATLHCLAVSECCFKIGRITVPPHVMLACEGFSVSPPSETGLTAYSLDNPPPHWETVRALRPKGNLKPLREFLKGGWRNSKDPFWESALGGEIEEKRRVRLELVGGVQKGMENARAVC